ncbi:bifunctional diaminohydroxyphosphoribosylaminopyrimidine deaminase/5-amino-6-(5-phosphoribosylamino)uracil reductase RibD [Pragia fontium]|uniref:Riboflavin biosynthesis protein RibD n=1 Tax=Pragia fontium DSM 5563 = ATCC 49100 TaxID=1122977 RepID=A0AAJ5BHA6_9GAMM|nr:bifunctional diaminohydroxyphosphoribosylaminopyrimidine deaminase/5-amino-6-(5-phosphoribosylamino)uracil reductase RibD [Pragia fontium]SFC88096.1 diaminohydroxyphosphoribosylaminopyrimidine deaminase [Pragia fontium DSM 5563 = ATCC 49100]VEJ56049.1 Riboflavin biosynthesis protein RibD [Pragia fontium]
MQNDAQFMARALELARMGRFTTTPNPNVGCVLVRDGVIVGEGYHHKAGEPHAEVHALRMAGEQAKGATAYVTLEPCSHHGRTPPCADALVNAGVVRVIAAMQDPNPEVAGRGLYRLQQAGIAVEHGLMMAEAEAVNRGFFKRMRTGFPYLQLKLAASLDGKTAMASGESQWITSVDSRRDVQQFRAQSSAILSTSATVLADNPSLNVRWSELNDEIQQYYPQDALRQPVRVILDRHNRLTPDLKLFSLPGDIWLVRSQKGHENWPPHVEQLIVPEHNGGLDLVVLMMQLGRRQINTIWTEAGPTIAGALLQAGLVDELVLYLAPKLLGDGAMGLCKLPGLERLSQALQFKLHDVQQTGDDLRLRLFTHS